MHKVSVIIPAFNEEKTIQQVIKTVEASGLATEIIVVNDGSTDSTMEISSSGLVKVFHLPENRGKGNALAVGVKNALCDVVLFLDADLVGLKSQHLSELLNPVLNGDVKMTVGKFQSGEFWTTLSQHITPFLSGQRAIEKEVLNHFENMENLGFGVETALTLYFKRNNIRMKMVKLPYLTHVVKERKFGFVKGFFLRMKMYVQIVKSILKHYLI